MASNSIDYSQPLATVLRESTIQVHHEIERSKGAELLLSGALPREEYARFLMMLWHVYDTFERALDKTSSHPVLEPTYNPQLLRRTPALAADIAYLLQDAAWQAHPIHQELLLNRPPALTAYVQRIENIAASADPAPLLAHSYVRYLGDLSGGQNIRNVLRKAYDLEDDKGLSFYQFRELATNKVAGLGEMKRIKDWFRAGMNTGGEAASQQSKSEIAEEAQNVFRLNQGVFEAIRIGNRTDRVLDYDRRKTNESQSAVSLALVVPFLAAVGLVLLLGGFVGDFSISRLFRSFSESA